MRKPEVTRSWVNDSCEDSIRWWAWVLGALDAGIYASLPWGWLWGGVSAMASCLIVASLYEWLHH